MDSGALKECLGTCVVIAGKKNSVKFMLVTNHTGTEAKGQLWTSREQPCDDEQESSGDVRCK